jgi:hypothetical protein
MFIILEYFYILLLNIIYLYTISTKYENRKMCYIQVGSILATNILGLIYYILTKNVVLIFLISVYIYSLLCLLILQIVKNKNNYKIINNIDRNDLFDESLITESLFEYNNLPNNDNSDYY